VTTRATILTAALTGLLAAAAFAGAGPASAGRAAVSAGQARCAPTPQDAGGPFSTGEPPQRSRTGTGHVLTGVVLSSVTCRPIAHARVEFWQSDRQGRYLRSLSATVVTDARGRFRYESPMPVADDGFPGHIHVRVDAASYVPLLTRYEPHGSHRGNLTLVLLPAAL